MVDLQSNTLKGVSGLVLLLYIIAGGSVVNEKCEISQEFLTRVWTYQTTTSFVLCTEAVTLLCRNVPHNERKCFLSCYFG